MSRKYKIIRDAVHGDIILENKYLKVIDTLEFQRLRRIKQLSVGNMVFPGAEHTRFSHSIGTFYVMERIIQHFDKIFSELNIPIINDNDKDVALLSALLHDIGHGPFSHSFESVHTSQSGEKISHEDMSIEIILNRESGINKVLIQEFGENMPELVADTIQKKASIKKGELNGIKNKLDIQFVISSLISGQLDADRMDYLLRDAMFTGVKFGNIDLSRLIEGLTLSIRDNQYSVCVNEKYIPDIESYLSGRYQMHREVYLHDFKCEMELIIKQILLRAKILFKEGLLETDYLPKAIITLFRGEKLSVNEYITLDDTILYSLFHIWRLSDDVELASLCNSILTRSKFKKVLVINDESKEIGNFKDEFTNILDKYGIQDIDFNDMSYFLEIKDDVKAYKGTKDNIYVVNRYSILEDFQKVSNLIKDDIKETKRGIFMDLELFKKVYKYKCDNLYTEVEELIKKYDSRNHIEIEAKYIIQDEKIFEEIKNIVRKQGYIISERKEKNQIDSYYDTEKFILRDNLKTLRIREIKDEFSCTIKLPVGEKNENDSNNKRYEYDEKGNTRELSAYRNHISNHLNLDIKEIDTLQKMLVVKNNREKYTISNNGDSSVEFEMVLDKVRYENVKNNMKFEEIQVEIELKSDYFHRVCLKRLTDELEGSISEIEINTKSKYERGLELTN